MILLDQAISVWIQGRQICHKYHRLILLLGFYEQKKVRSNRKLCNSTFQMSLLFSNYDCNIWVTKVPFHL